MKNWIYNHDLLALSNSLGTHLGAYCEFTPKDGGAVEYPPPVFCPECQIERTVFLPTKEYKEQFREQLIIAQKEYGSPSNISPSLNHFWYHARCSECGADLILMRS